MKNKKFNTLVDSMAGHIKKPYTLDEMIDILESGEYNAEMILQHLLLFVANKTKDKKNAKN